MISYYAADDFYEFLNDIPDEPPEPIRGISTRREGGLDALPWWCSNLIETGAEPGKRSEGTASVISAMLRAGWNEEQIREVFERYPIGEKYREKGAGGEKWLRDEIERARSIAGSPSPIKIPPAFTPEQTSVSKNLTSEPAEAEAILTYNGIALLVRGIIGCIAAAGGIGKTMFLLMLAYALSHGGKVGPLKAVQEFKVLMLCGEDDIAEIHRRLWRIAKGQGFPENLHVASTFGSNIGPLMHLDKNNPAKAPGWHWLRETIITHGKIDVLILDPKSRFFGLDENSNDDATAWITCLESLAREFGITILFAHHVPKAAKQNGSLDANMARGASALVDGCRWVAGFSQLTDSSCKRYGIDDPRPYVAFDVVKSNYAAKLPSQFVFKRVEGGLLQYCALEVERRDSLMKILYDAFIAEPGKYSRRDLDKGANGAKENIFEVIAEQFPKFERSKELSGLLDDMIKGQLLREGEIGNSTAGRKKLAFYPIEQDLMNLGQRRI